jgi:hypothetical protein
MKIPVMTMSRQEAAERGMRLHEVTFQDREEHLDRLPQAHLEPHELEEMGQDG